MRTHPICSMVVLCALALAACERSPIQPTLRRPFQPLSDAPPGCTQAGLTIPDPDATGHTEFSGSSRACSTIVNVYYVWKPNGGQGDIGTLAQEVISAINMWNSNVLSSYQLPQLSYAGQWTGSPQDPGGPTTIILTFHDVPAQPTGERCWEGDAGQGASTGDASATWSTTTVGGTPVCPGRSSSTDPAWVNDQSLHLIVAHELGHTLGFNHLNPPVVTVNGQLVGTVDGRWDPPGILCIMAITPYLGSPYGATTPAPQLASAPCEQERQLIYYYYGLRGYTAIDPTAFLTHPTVSLTPPPPASLTIGSTQALTAPVQGYQGAAGDGEGSPGYPAPALAWTSSGGAVGLANTQTSGSGTQTNTASANSIGSATIAATIQLDQDIAWPVTAPATASISVTPLNPPSALVVNFITTSSATLNWTAGSSQASTVIQTEQTGTANWTPLTTVGPGNSTYPDGGLTSCVPYDVQLYHTLNGHQSASYTTTDAFAATSATGACTPLSFTLTGCKDTVVQNGKFQIHDEVYYVGWTRTEFTIKSWFDIGQSSTNDPATATVVGSGQNAAGPHTELGPFDKSTTYSLYFWIRQRIGTNTVSPWVALAGNPIIPSQLCPLN